MRPLPALLVAFVLLIAACEEPPTPQEAPERPSLETEADSLAMRAVDAIGGYEVWQQLPGIRFDFAIDRGDGRELVASHLWNRDNGDYRLEINRGDEDPIVVLFNVNTREGSAYQGGEQLGDEETGDLLEQAYQRYINDTYWLKAPAKVFDEGVNRSAPADSATATQDVLHLSFGDVGLTPDDRYWLYINTETGLVDRWGFILQGSDEDAEPRFFAWTEYVTLGTPHGEIRIAERKDAEAEGGASILTDNVSVITSFSEADFEDPEPRL